MAKGKYEYWRTEEGLLLLSSWAKDGLTDEQIAINMGINVATLYRYKEKYCEICEALKKGKEIADYEVENALFKRAVGYTQKQTVKELRRDMMTGEDCLVVTRVFEKEIPPDTTAQIYWLKNRRPDKWRDKKEFENTSDSEKQAKLLEAIEKAVKVGNK